MTRAFSRMDLAHRTRGIGFIACAALAAGCGTAAYNPDDAYLGGDTTIFDTSEETLSNPDHNLGADQRPLFQIGDAIFNRNWVQAPATPKGNDGLGPLYNATSCSGCHDGGGPGLPPKEGDGPFRGIVMRLSIPGATGAAPVPEPTYGTQFAERGVVGVPSEGVVHVHWEEVPGMYPDGEKYSLRKPTFTFAKLNYGPMAAGVMVSPRLAPNLPGMGLLEAVPESTILGFANEQAAAGGPIHGHPNHVVDESTGQTMIGRFGLKANLPTARAQTLAAFINDIGITNSVYSSEVCSGAEAECAGAASGFAKPELEAVKEQGMVMHTIAIAVGGRRDLDRPETQAGYALFNQIGCATCHVPKMKTGTLDGYPSVSNQTIRPFTDLLLHDMGDGLADGRPDYEASGREWRTKPLWEVGLLRIVTEDAGGVFYLHDGRARDLAEAILWHGGEAEAAREAFRNLSKADRTWLLAFLKSL